MDRIRVLDNLEPQHSINFNEKKCISKFGSGSDSDSDSDPPIGLNFPRLLSLSEVIEPYRRIFPTLFIVNMHETLYKQ